MRLEKESITKQETREREKRSSLVQDDVYKKIRKNEVYEV